jgi:hypothetical protein
MVTALFKLAAAHLPSINIAGAPSFAAPGKVDWQLDGGRDSASGKLALSIFLPPKQFAMCPTRDCNSKPRNGEREGP